MSENKEYLYDKAVILEKALKAAPGIKAKLDEEKEEELLSSSSDTNIKTTGYIYTDPEILAKMPNTINKVLLEVFNERMIRTQDFIDFVIEKKWQPDEKKAKNYVNNKIKILREGCDMKFSNVVSICEFLKIQIDFIIN